ncbi:hypothetical protein [Kineothrix sp. MB12-C1]|uniref:hypothetical protein n=1 Tax=Kineothrix sp. MB12-C1 TaxID=3070215 RepID=UPI0027D272C2|nr:hypothetical protein [Kineothrix sp. MB12-C1]WMC92702.1 hypothetical protein RBB56_18110 [Kineothrix sp. MB12-C1]WMC92750.1 hypothetical protein RBB56_00235 [Kineothrix sp. MB12-C1]
MNCLILLLLLCCCGNNNGVGGDTDWNRKPCGRNDDVRRGNAGCNDTGRGNVSGNRGSTWGCSEDIPDKKPCEDDRGSRPEQRFDNRQMNEFYGDDLRRGYNPYAQGTTCGCEE